MIQAAALTGATAIDFDSSRTDIRDGEFAVLVTPGNLEDGVKLIKIATVGASTTTLQEALTADVSRGTWICPAIVCTIEGAPAMTRMAVNNVAKVT